MLRPTLKHPDFRSVLDGEPGGIGITEVGDELRLHIPGRLDRERAEAIEEMIWNSLHFASHLRSERLGEFTIGTDLHRSESLALIQLLILYHLFTATASAALGGAPIARASRRRRNIQAVPRGHSALASSTRHAPASGPSASSGCSLLVLFVALVVVAIYTLIRLTRSGRQRRGGAAAGADAAVESVRMRYARGEIDRDEFVRVSTDLGAPPPAAAV